MINARRLTTTLLAAAGLAGAAASPAAAGPLETMRVPEAIAAAGPLQPVPVVTLDTGLDLDHPAFAGRIQPNGRDLIGTNEPGETKPDNDPSDPVGGSGHGTVVAGVLADVSPNARFEALRTCWDGDQCYQYIQAEAIELAAARGVKVVSMSWLSGELEPGLRQAITSHPEMLFVGIPSGNGGAYDADGENPQPCNAAPNVLCVSTAAADDGLDCGAYGRTSVDVALPTRGFNAATNGGGTTTTGCATSFAAPGAAGVAAILYGVKPEATGAQIRDAITGSARPVPAWAGKSVSGGIIDAAAAVERLKSGTGPAPVAFGATVSRSGRTLNISATGDGTVTGTIRRGGRVRKRVNRALIGGFAKVTLPAKRGRYGVALTVTSTTGETVAINRSYRVK